VALSELVPAERSALLEEAQQIALSLQSAPMRDALGRLRAGDRDAGMLTPFVTRYRALEDRKPHIAIHVLAADVRIEEHPARLTPTEFGVVAMLARQQRWHASSELCEELYPELDGETAENRLYVYVHRVRLRLGRDAILAGPAGYRLGPHVTTDLADADDLLRAVAATNGGGVSEAQCERLLRLTPLTRDELSARLSRARLPASLQSRAEELRRNLLLCAARAAREQGAVAEVLRIADALIADDRCDGDAHGLRIRAFLGQGDRWSAESSWRSYRAALLGEFGSEPAPFDTYAG
jgi:DNA-binding SARP family transcriptional activator